MAAEILSKLCTKCGVVKHISEFSKSKSRKDGLNGHCKACIKKWQIENSARYKEVKRLAHERNKEHNNARSAKWREQNKSYAKQYMEKWLVYNKHNKAEGDRRYREKNADVVKQNKQRYYMLNSEHVRERVRRYQKQNAVKLRPLRAASTRKRNAVKRCAAPIWASQKQIVSIYKDAVRISAETGIPHEVDHIVPMQSKVVCGLHCESNLQIVPMKENRSKGNRWWPDMP